MKMTNEQIYFYASNLMKEFSNDEFELPIKINFYLQKNKQKMFELAEEIEKIRNEIAKKYGVQSEENPEDFIINEEHFSEATKELYDLFNLEQEVQIYTVKLNSFDENLILTNGQMNALMFMIEE